MSECAAAAAAAAAVPANDEPTDRTDAANDYVVVKCTPSNLDYKHDGSYGPLPRNANEACFALLWQLLSEQYASARGTAASVVLDLMEPSAKGKFIQLLLLVTRQAKSSIARFEAVYAPRLHDTAVDADGYATAVAPGASGEQEAEGGAAAPAAAAATTTRVSALAETAAAKRVATWHPVIMSHADEPLDANASYNATARTLYGVDVVRTRTDATARGVERLVLTYANDAGERFVHNMRTVPLIDKTALMAALLTHLDKNNVQFGAFVRDARLATQRLFKAHISCYDDAIMIRSAAGTDGAPPPADDKGERYFLCTHADLAPTTADTRHLAKVVASTYVHLSSAQRMAVRKVCEERVSTFVTGPAGTGKSVVLRVMCEKLRLANRRYAVTATTARAGLGVGGKTFHSFMGIGLGTESARQCVKALVAKARNAKRWQSRRGNGRSGGGTPADADALPPSSPMLDRLRETEVLFIDEISMMSVEYFAKADDVLRIVRQAPGEPFGGMQLVLCGDFFQLPPVYRNEAAMREAGLPLYCFQLDVWREAVHCEVELTKVYRQLGATRFIAALNEMREGRLSDEHVGMLRARVVGSSVPGAPTLADTDGATRIYPRRDEVDNVNNRKLRDLPGPFHECRWRVEFNAELVRGDTAQKACVDHFASNTPVTATQVYAVGARVLLRVNLDQENGLVNGAIGTVVGFEPDPDDIMQSGSGIPGPPSQFDVYAHDGGGGGAAAAKASAAPLTLYPVVKFDDIDEPRHILPYCFQLLAATSGSGGGGSGDDEQDDAMRSLKELVAAAEAPGATNAERESARIALELCADADRRAAKPQWRARMYQVPLVLGWASTVHSAQGMSLKRVGLGVDKMFTTGQVYVGTSRAETLDGLYLYSFDESKIRADPIVADYYAKVRKAQRKLRSAYRAQIRAQVAAKRARLYVATRTTGSGGGGVAARPRVQETGVANGHPADAAATSPRRQQQDFVRTYDMTKPLPVDTVRSTSRLYEGGGGGGGGGGGAAAAAVAAADR